MFRPIFLFKVLILSLGANFILVLYLLSQKSHYQIPIATNNYFYDFHDYYTLYQNNPMATNVKVIPIPHFFSKENSKLFLSKNFRIVSNQKITDDLQSAILRYTKYISLITKISIETDQKLSTPENSLAINCPSIDSDKNKYPELGEDESYKLKIIKNGSYISASSLTGVIRGLSTFIQLIERDKKSKKSYVPFVNIIDRPRFIWRGLLLDVCRHWMPMKVIERTLNAMELSKLNVLHLHLSDDQGFRVESIRHNLLHDRKLFFTQKDIEYIVEYARQRRIRIVPEFDIPGHTTSWFVGYPELATEPGPYQVGSEWGVMKATMDATKESTYTFLDSFFDEMTKLFPDPYFHIGGDEVEGSQWEMSRLIQRFILEHKLRNKNGLQAYFNKRIQKMLNKNGKIMVGWEEILDEVDENLAVDKDAIIQSWKSRKSLTKTITKGYRGLLSYGYYLDHLLLSTIHYKTDPILNDELWLFNETELSGILGGEACMWSEYVTETTVDSRIWPRVIAIAERLWSPSAVDNTYFLYERLFRMNRLLDKIQTGVTQFPSYKTQLSNLILHPDKRKDLLHPFTILADVCEATGYSQRTQSGTYSSIVPLTTFTDALFCESEQIWKLENLPIHDKTFREVFQTWSINHVRLRQLFEDTDMNRNKQLWVQDVEQLSKNLANIGQIGLRVLDYGAKRILHRDKNNTMNTWPLMHWVGQHNMLLNQLENQISEVRLAAARPVRRLLNSLEKNV